MSTYIFCVTLYCSIFHYTIPHYTLFYSIVFRCILVCLITYTLVQLSRGSFMEMSIPLLAKHGTMKAYHLLRVKLGRWTRPTASTYGLQARTVRNTWDLASFPKTYRCGKVFLSAQTLMTLHEGNAEMVCEPICLIGNTQVIEVGITTQMMTSNWQSR